MAIMQDNVTAALEEMEDQGSSIATIEHVNVSNSKCPPTSFQEKICLELAKNDRESLKTQPRTALSLAQLKDKELKIKKMQKKTRNGR